MSATATARSLDQAPLGGAARRPPILLIATANEAQGARHLRSLASELEDIVAALATAQREGICEVVTLPEATPEQIVTVFQTDAYRDRVAVLHFAGHAGPQGLLLETPDGDTAVADAAGLAAFLGCQRGLQLVVLNACATNAHVDALRNAGVGSVIATSRTVEDAIAHEFAVLFYQGLGSGAGIQRAYDEAAGGVRFKHGAIASGVTADSMHASATAVSRDIGRQGPARSLLSLDGRWPWDIYFRSGAEETVGPWNLPDAAGNPLFGLPPLPETNVVLSEPFRHLRPFVREHAELFFGRGKDIRELYDKLTGTTSEPVLLLYGATGVGKSSLLDAGLLPRLTTEYEVRYVTRDRALRLLGTLGHVVDPATEDLSGARLAEAWRQQESHLGRPLLIVVDQVEQAFTTEDSGQAAIGDAARELDAFGRALGAVFENDVTRPRGRLVLGLRKEWLADVRSALTLHRVARSEHHVEQLTRAGVVEAIAGPTRLPTRRMPTRLELEPGLDVLIADDLLAKRASHVAPLLQILLAEMWAEAPRQDDVVRFDVRLYEQVQAKAKQLDEFLSQQLSALRAWHAPTVDSGLALDFLRFYTTSKATADEHSLGEESTRYPHASEPPPGLRAMCARLFLLVERATDDEGSPLPERPARLAHDTLAPIVRERFDRSDLPGPRAKRILDGRSAEWTDGAKGTALDAADLKLVEAGEHGMRVWSNEERALIAASREARERARRRRAWLIRGAVGAITAIVGFGGGSWILYRQSQARLAESTSREFATRALSVDADRRDVALTMAVAAFERAPTFEARRALFTQLAAEPALIRVFATTATAFGFSAGGRALALQESDSVVVRDIETGRILRTVKPARGSDTWMSYKLDATSLTFSGIVRRDTSSNLRFVGVWDVETGQRLGEFGMQTRTDDNRAWTIGSVRPNGMRLGAYATPNGEVVVVDVGSGRELRRLTTQSEIVFPAMFSPDGSVLLTVETSGLATAWNAEQGTKMRSVPMELDGPPVLAVAIARANDMLAISAGDTTTWFPLSGAAPPISYTAPDLELSAFSSDDSLVALATPGGTIQVMRTRSVIVRGTLHGSRADTRALAFDPSGKRLAALSKTNLVHVWDLESTGVVTSSRLPVAAKVRWMRLDQSGRYVIVREDSAVAVWDLRSRQRHGRFPYRVTDMLKEQDIGPEDVSVVADGRQAIVARRASYFAKSVADSLLVFDVGAARVTNARELPDAKGLVVDQEGTHAAYALDSTHRVVVASVAESGRLDTLDIEGKYGINAQSAAFSVNGALLAFQPDPGTIVIWDVAARRVRNRIDHADSLGTLRWSADGKVLASVGPTTVVFWRLGDRTPLSRVQLTTEASFAAFSPDGSLFATSATYGVSLFDVTRGEEIGTVEFPSVQTGSSNYVARPSVGGITFTDDGRALLVVRSDGTIDRIDADPESWAARACSIAASESALSRWTRAAPAGTSAPRHCFGNSVRR